MEDCKYCNQTVENCECHIPSRVKHKGLWEMSELSSYEWDKLFMYESTLTRMFDSDQRVAMALLEYVRKLRKKFKTK